MVSNLALADIERTEREHGQMSIADIVRLNALALRITDDPASDLCMMPRVAVVGDVLLRQPNLRQEIALRQMECVYSRDGQTSIAMVAYVLAHPDIDAERLLAHPYITAIRISRWVSRHMADETLDRMAACCRYCLDGCD